MNFISKPSVSYKTLQTEYESEFKLFFNSQSPEKEINMVAIKESFDAIIHPSERRFEKSQECYED